LGRGGYGYVYKAFMKYTGLYRAAKKIKKSSINKDEQ
jgi:calcium-dependent protein kinase